MTEKRKPTYDLASMKAAFSAPDRLIATSGAIQGAAQLGMGRQEIVDVLQGIDRSHFYKSMTSNADHTVWQDVYHADSTHGKIYVKFTAGAVSEFVLLSFKEK